MFRVFLDKARVAARYLRRVWQEIADAQQHLVPVLLAAGVVALGVARWT